jgi:8-hydroxy-5-deazaflavin:NADPH oxidoreductase
VKIGVLGAGRMAAALVPHWLLAGHDVLIGGRTVPKAIALAERLGARGGGLREAAEFSDVVVLAVLYPGLQATLDGAGAEDGTLAGKPLLDCNNPVETERFTLDTHAGSSLAEKVAASTGARVVKALNLAHAEVWKQRARYHGRPLMVPIAGDDAAKEPVARLVRDAGGEPLDAGGLEQAQHLEAMAAVIIRLLFAGADELSAFQFEVGARS